MLAFIGGVPRQIVSDNLHAGITRACFYEPLVNRTYADMASHYGTAVIPARPYKPRDKAKVEVGVQVVQRWILARLRNRRFFSLAELNQAIRELVDQLNDRPMRGWGTTRRALYEQLDRPALRALPPAPYEYADWKRCRVNLDYHVEIDKHFYSVPFRLLREEVEARITAKTVEIFHRGKLVATHLRSLRPYRPTTVAEHMPSSHRRYRDWTHERILREAAAIGDDTAALVEIILRSRPHPEQGFRSCIGILGLAKRYDAERLDAACARALALGTRSYSSVAAILKNAQERKRARTGPAPACSTRTFAAPATTIERKDDADPPPGRAPARPRHGRHGRCVPRDAEQFRRRRPLARGLARPAARPRSDRARQQASWPTAEPGPVAPERGGRGHRLPRTARSGPCPVPQTRRL